MSCECHSARRDLVIIAERIDEDHPLVNAGKLMGWELAPKYDAVRLPVGSACQFESIEAVIDFLQSSAANLDTKELRGLLLKPTDRLEDNLGELAHADRLENYQESAGRIHEILVNERITSHFQSIVDADENIWGFECLMRAQTPEGETVSPAEVISEAHEEHLHFRLDRLCRETHLKNAAHERLYEDYHICINFLPTSIYQPEFCLRTTTALAEELKIPRERIWFEVVETEEVEDREHLISILNQYRSKGFRVGLDDVGAGYSSLGFLGDLKPDLLKIDMDIVSNIPENNEYMDIVDSLVKIASRIGATVVAEGIEENEQFECLAEKGVDLFQGYSFSRPNPNPKKQIA